MAVWRSTFATAKLRSVNISYLHVYVWQSLTEPPNLNLPIYLQWRFWAQPPNLNPANISGYTVLISEGGSMRGTINKFCCTVRPNSYTFSHTHQDNRIHTWCRDYSRARVYFIQLQRSGISKVIAHMNWFGGVARSIRNGLHYMT